METQKWAPVVVRIGMSLVFLWFGTQQLLNPEQWIGFVPPLASSIAPLNTIVLVNGLTEVILGLALIVGFQVRIASLLLAIHLFGITFFMGLTPVGVRDFGLSVATLSIFLHGKDTWSFS